MNDKTRKLYNALRKQGYMAQNALSAAKTQVEFDDNENVRLVVKADEFCDMDDLKGDTYNPEANPSIPASRLEREEKEFEEKVNREGVYGLVGEYRCPHCGEWKQADSCWGFVGQEFGGYEYDIMQLTLDALKNAK